MAGNDAIRTRGIKICATLAIEDAALRRKGIVIVTTIVEPISRTPRKD